MTNILLLSKKLLTLFLSLTTFTFITQAQTGTIKGVIKDEKTNEPLIGATVLIEETTYGAAADLDGNYIIPNVAAGT